MSGEFSLIRRGLSDRVARARRIVARATAAPLAVRLVVFAAAVGAQGFAYPVEAFTGSPVVLVLLVAAVPALWPRSAFVTVFLLFTAVGWLAVTTVLGSTATLPRLIGLSVALYAVHSAAALAAVLPYDAVVDRLVLARWLLRGVLVLAVATVASVAAMRWAAGTAPRTYLAATLAGLAAAPAVAWLIARSTRP